MAFNIMNLFRGGSNNTPQLDQNNQPRNPNLDPNARNPALDQQNNQNNQNNQNQNQNAQVKPGEKQSPEVDFSEFWTIDPKKGDAVAPDLSAFSFGFNAEKAKKLGADISRIDFTKGLSPDIVKKIQGGGDDAVSATLAAMNYIGQQVMQNSVVAGAKITETGIATSGQRVAESIPHMIRQQTVSNALREDNPLFNDPSTAPMLAAIEVQMAAKFPSATPDEIREQSKNFMANFAEKAAQFSGLEISRPSGNQQRSQQSKASSGSVQQDWSDEPTF